MAFTPSKLVAEEAADALKLDIVNLMKNGPEDVLRETQNAQPALMVAGLMAFTYISKQLGKPVQQLAAFTAGHSLGEYTAVAAAGGLKFADAVKLVRIRGEAMAKAVPVGQGAMAAVMGLEIDVLEKAIQATGAIVANDNAPGQLILSGPLAAVEKAEEAAKAAGAKRVLRLNVAGPFHTPAMLPAAYAVEAQLAATPIQPLAVPVVMNATAQAAQAPHDVTRNLVTQITSRVKWRESMAHMANKGITQVLELGVGKVLTGLAPRCDVRLAATALDTPQAIDTWLQANA